MGLLSRMPVAGMMGPMMDPRMQQHFSAAEMMQQQAMQPQVDPSLAAYGQTQMGVMPDMTQGKNDAAAAAYGGAGGLDMGKMGAWGVGMMANSQPKFGAPPPPMRLDPYRFRRT